MSYVATEQKVCPVCGTVHDSGALLIDRRLRDDAFDDKNAVTGYDLCPEHQKQLDEGYIFLIEATTPPDGATMKLEEADRTGRYAAIRREVAEKLFDIEAKDINFCDLQVLSMLEDRIGAPDD